MSLIVTTMFSSSHLCTHNSRGADRFGSEVSGAFELGENGRAAFAAELGGLGDAMAVRADLGFRWRWRGAAGGSYRFDSHAGPCCEGFYALGDAGACPVEFDGCLDCGCDSDYGDEEAGGWAGPLTSEATEAVEDPEHPDHDNEVKDPYGQCGSGGGAALLDEVALACVEGGDDEDHDDVLAVWIERDPDRADPGHARGERDESRCGVKESVRVQLMAFCRRPVDRVARGTQVCCGHVRRVSHAS